MKLYYFTCITLVVSFFALAVYANQQRPTTLAELIYRSNHELAMHKMNQLYGNAYD